LVVGLENESRAKGGGNTEPEEDDVDREYHQSWKTRKQKARPPKHLALWPIQDCRYDRFVFKCRTHKSNLVGAKLRNEWLWNGLAATTDLEMGKIQIQ